MKIVKMPEIEFNGAESLTVFYKKLGWTGEKKVDPTKVIVNRQQNEEMIKKFMNSFPKEDKIGAGFIWMNMGPSSSNDVEYGTVRLEDGWVK